MSTTSSNSAFESLHTAEVGPASELSAAESDDGATEAGSTWTGDDHATPATAEAAQTAPSLLIRPATPPDFASLAPPPPNVGRFDVVRLGRETPDVPATPNSATTTFSEATRQSLNVDDPVLGLSENNARSYHSQHCIINDVLFFQELTRRGFIRQPAFLRGHTAQVGIPRDVITSILVMASTWPDLGSLPLVLDDGDRRDPTFRSRTRRLFVELQGFSPRDEQVTQALSILLSIVVTPGVQVFLDDPVAPPPISSSSANHNSHPHNDEHPGGVPAGSDDTDDDSMYMSLEDDPRFEEHGSNIERNISSGPSALLTPQSDVVPEVPSLATPNPVTAPPSLPTSSISDLQLPFSRAASEYTVELSPALASSDAIPSSSSTGGGASSSSSSRPPSPLRMPARLSHLDTAVRTYPRSQSPSSRGGARWSPSSTNTVLESHSTTTESTDDWPPSHAAIHLSPVSQSRLSLPSDDLRISTDARLSNESSAATRATYGSTRTAHGTSSLRPAQRTSPTHPALGSERYRDRPHLDTTEATREMVQATVASFAVHTQRLEQFLHNLARSVGTPPSNQREPSPPPTQQAPPAPTRAPAQQAPPAPPSPAEQAQAPPPSPTGRSGSLTPRLYLRRMVEALYPRSQPSSPVQGPTQAPPTSGRPPPSAGSSPSRQPRSPLSADDVLRIRRILDRILMQFLGCELGIISDSYQLHHRSLYHFLTIGCIAPRHRGTNKQCICATPSTTVCVSASFTTILETAQAIFDRKVRRMVDEAILDEFRELVELLDLFESPSGAPPGPHVHPLRNEGIRSQPPDPHFVQGSSRDGAPRQASHARGRPPRQDSPSRSRDHTPRP